MDLTPLYELRGRLRAAAVAGSALAGEDFRLRRAAQAMEPLEGASPVFARIGQLTKQLLDPGCEDREGTLLDAVTLVDAVLCTQGAVAVEGTLTPLAPAEGGELGADVPYSQLQPLLEALTSSGSGHFSYCVEMHREHPEIFRDWRVRPALVDALGASYGELADQAQDWLSQADASLLPLLQKGFDPQGKREMVRRVHVMEAIAPLEAADFARRMLPQAAKEVRQALIYALRLDPENGELLKGLAGSERGRARDMALYALAELSGEPAVSFWREYYEKAPLETLEYLRSSQTDWAGELVGETILTLLADPDSLNQKKEPSLADKAKRTDPRERLSAPQLLLVQALADLPGKTGEKICLAFRRLAEAAGDLEAALTEAPRYLSQCLGYVLPAGAQVKKLQAGSLKAWIPCLLQLSLLTRPDPQLGALARELFAQGARSAYLPAALTDLLISGQEYGSWLEGYLWKKNLLGGRKKNEDMVRFTAQGLKSLRFREETGEYVLTGDAYIAALDRRQTVYHPLSREPLLRLLHLLMEVKDEDLDRILGNCIPPKDPQVCRELEEYFYRRMEGPLEEGAPLFYLGALKKCGCQRCENLALWTFSRHSGSVPMWTLMNYASALPGPAADRKKEMLRVVELADKGRLSVTNWNRDRMLAFLDGMT